MLIGTYLWGQDGLLKVDGCFAYGWTEDNTVTIFLTPQRMTPTSCLIHGSFIPKKTQEGHVIKESPSCRFFNTGSQLFFLKRHPPLLSQEAVWVLGFANPIWVARSPFGQLELSPTCDVYVQPHPRVPRQGCSRAAPNNFCVEKKEPPPGPGGSCPSPRRWWSSGDQPAVGLEVTLRRFR